jgi:hypothetical protein
MLICDCCGARLSAEEAEATPPEHHAKALCRRCGELIRACGLVDLGGGMTVQYDVKGEQLLVSIALTRPAVGRAVMVLPAASMDKLHDYMLGVNRALRAWAVDQQLGPIPRVPQ